MNHYIAAVWLLQFFVGSLQSDATDPANTTLFKWREILPNDCGYIYDELDEKWGNLPRRRRSADSVDIKIMKRQITTIAEHPWQVAVIRSDDRVFECGGSIISKYHVLTAAHCFTRVTNDTKNDVNNQAASLVSQTKRLVAVGDSRYNESKLVYKIKELYLHNSYTSSHRRNDIALLKIDGEFVWSRFVSPICLPVEDEQYTPGLQCRISGFGNVGTESPSQSGIIQSGKVLLSTDDNCKKENEKNQGIATEEMFCASGQTEQGRDVACQVDSGGPLHCYDRSGTKHVLFGITSVGHGCGLNNSPGVYTKVSKYLQWIHGRVEGRFKEETQIKNERTTQKPASIEFPSDCGVMKPRMPLSADMANVPADDANFHIEKTPWLVALMFAKHNSHWSCGAIISKKYVLTAAHGVYTPSRTRFSDGPMVEFILAGDPSLQESERKYKIARIIFHPEYNARTFGNDLALIETNDEFIFSDKIQPICMPYDELYRVNFNVIFTGWLQGELSSTTGLYRRVHELADRSQCSKKYDGYKLTTNMFCSVDRNVEETAVFGDVGGPLFANGGVRHYLLGVFSWRRNATVFEKYPRIFTKVINYKEWIREVMTGTDKSKIQSGLQLDARILGEN